MKRFLPVLLALVLLCSGSVYAGSAALDSADRSVSIGVYVGSFTAAPTVYSVEIVWGELRFTYNQASLWDESTHTFDYGSSYWSASGNTIVVSNHSNTDIAVRLSYLPDRAHSAIAGSFDISSFELPTAVGTSAQAPPSRSAVLTLSGTPSLLSREFVRVGIVTVQIS